MKGFALYIHIPFCVRRCYYCNFVSYTDARFIENYILALKQEIKRYARKYKGREISSIFIGGGTPSVLPEGKILDLMDYIKEYFSLAHDVEITIESNPNSITEGKLKEYLQSGINRISVGGQSCNDKILKAIGRSHNFQDLDDAITLIKKVGFKNINVDLLIGLPNQKIADVKKAVNYLTKKGVQHISAYSLIVENDTAFDEMVKSGMVTLPSEDLTVKMYDTVNSLLAKKGFQRYEVSNFSKPYYQCKHNLNYWQQGDYLGVGLSSHSYMDGVRWGNVCGIREYINNIREGKSVIDGEEVLTKEQKKEETIMLALRTVYGLDIAKFNSDFNCNLLLDKSKEIAFLVKNNFISLNNNVLKVRNNSFYVLNSIIEKLV